MSRAPLPNRPRILSQNAHQFVNQKVSVIGEVISIVPHANTLTLRMPDDENMIVLLQKNTTTIEPNLLTEVWGTLVSRGQIDATWVKQFNLKETAQFNKNLYVETAQVLNAHREHYNV